MTEDSVREEPQTQGAYMSQLPCTDGEVISHDEPQLLRFRNARSSAFRIYSSSEMCAVDRRFAHCIRFVESGLYDEHGKLIELSERQGGLLGDQNLNISPMRRLPYDVLNKEQRHLSGRSIFLGLFIGHYGHFITEVLSRCWSLKGDNSYDHYVFYPFMFTKFEKFHEFFLKHIGIPRDKILFLDTETIFDEVDVPEQLWIMNGRGNAALRSFYAQFGARPRGSRRLFLSLLPSGRRSRLANIGEVEEIFRGQGFEILHPETLGIELQMEAYNNASVLAGFSGSALHNCIFAPNGCRLIEVGDTRSPNHYMPAQKVANALVSIEAYRIPFVESGPGSISGEHVLKRLERIIEVVSPASTSETTTSESLSQHLSRSGVLNDILSLFGKPSYLEIGVNRGQTFFAVDANHKVAVDPNFLFDVDDAKLKFSNAEFHAVESDVYFGDIVVADERFDVIFLDGLHTVEQTLRDFCNAIELLKDDGVIVIDDVVPNSYHASLPDLAVSQQARKAAGSTDKAWMGDVYRLVYFIETFFQQYRHATVIENHGQLVVWKGQRASKDLVRRQLEEIGRLPFEKTITERSVYNLRPFSEIMTILSCRKDRP